MSGHLLYFPCCNAVFDWFAESSGSGMPPVTVDLLLAQREFENLPGNGDRRIICHGCGDPAARYVVCRRTGRGAIDKLYPRRFPQSRHRHKPGCLSHGSELERVAARQDEPGSRVVPGGDFSAFRRELGDPEYRIVAMRQRNPQQLNNARALGGRLATRLTMGLQRLTREVLQRSGVCDWRPEYAGRRTPRVFNGLVKGALTALAEETAGKAAGVLATLPEANFVPWSFLDERRRLTPDAMATCVGFGFVESLSEENEHGARLMALSNHSQCPLVVPRSVLDHEARNARSPLFAHLAHPTWVIFVAAQYSGVWKIHVLVSFRMTAEGFIPVDSHHEERLVGRLIAEQRRFTRLLLPPSEFKGRKWIPDFQLQDTTERHYIEVAGLMAASDYAENIRRKCIALGPRLWVWDTRTPLGKFVLPSPNGQECTSRPSSNLHPNSPVNF